MLTDEIFEEKIKSLTNSNNLQLNFSVAYSGGMDSHVLLYAMANLKKKYPFGLRAVHVNHGLSRNADDWVVYCENICNQLNIKFVAKCVDVREKIKEVGKHSLEAVARELRYEEFARLLYENEYLLTAHHCTDQLETFLLQFFRGAGPAGLSAMPETKIFDKDKKLLRPLLNFSREELHEYALKNDLQWITDESNENIGIDRNFIRHKLIPVIKMRWPGVLKTSLRVSSHQAKAQKLLRFLAKEDYKKTKGDVLGTLSIRKLLFLDEDRQNNLIRYWLNELGFISPSSVKLEHVKTDVLLSSCDAMPLVKWGNCEVRKYKDNLYALSTLEKVDSSIRLEWDGKRVLKLPGDLGILDADFLKQKSIDSSSNLSIRFKRGGERILLKSGETVSLKKMMQKWNVPPWQRERVPLLYDNEDLIYVILKDLRESEKKDTLQI